MVRAMGTVGSVSRFLEPPERDRIGILKEKCLLFLYEGGCDSPAKMKKEPPEINNGRAEHCLPLPPRPNRATSAQQDPKSKDASSTLNNSQGNSDELL